MKSLMGALSLVAVLSMGLVGCGDDSGDVDMTVIDMSASGTTCSQIATCILGAGGDVTAIMACVAKGSTKAQGLYTALQTCGFTVCSMATDAGAAKCTSPTDSSAGCVSCATAAAQGASCSTQLSACFADK